MTKKNTSKKNEQKKHTLYVSWMHCPSCEVLLQKELESLDDTVVTSISYATWRVGIQTKQTKKALKRIVDECWYTLVDWPAECVLQTKETKDLHRRVQVVWIWVVVWLVFYMLQDIKLFGSFSQSASIWTALLMWIVASMSSCLAVTWSLIIGFSRESAKQKTPLRHTQALFHLWRVGTFFVLWSLLWLVGSVLQVSLTLTTILTIITGLVIVYMWLYMLDLTWPLARLWIRIPSSWSQRFLHLTKPKFAPLVWAATFLLPCWFTQSMQIIAMNTWDMWQGWLLMGLFALWTMPVLFLVGMGSWYVEKFNNVLCKRIIAVCILFFGIFSLSNARNLLWLPTSLSWVSWQQIEIVDTTQITPTTADIDKSYETITVWHDGRLVQPHKIELTQWKNYTLTIIPDSDWMWCMSTLVIPKLSRDVHPVVKSQAITYTITNAQAWKYPIVCWSMWMSQWDIFVQ